MSWEDLAEALSSQIKREIAENYFQEKVFLESSWEAYQKNLQNLNKLKEKIELNICRLYLLLEKENLIQEFERITGFPLRKCEILEKLDSKSWKKQIFKGLPKLPFALTTKSRFTKLFLELYRELFKNTQEYLKIWKESKEEYAELIEETKAFSKRFDLPSILNFFSKLSDTSPEIIPPQEKETLYKELVNSLKIKIPQSPDKLYPLYPLPKDPKEIRSDLIKLAKKVFEVHQILALEILNLVSQKD